MGDLSCEGGKTTHPHVVLLSRDEFESRVERTNERVLEVELLKVMVRCR